MIPALCAFSFSYLTSNCLNGGGSPAAWQKEMAREALCLNRVIRCASAGTAGLGGPRLCSGPLFGYGLELATSATVAATRVEPAPSVRRSHGRSVRECQSARPTRHPVSSSETARQSIKDCAQLPTRASRDFLNLAAEAAAPATVVRAHPDRGVPISAVGGRGNRPPSPPLKAPALARPLAAKLRSPNRNPEVVGTIADTKRTLTNRLVRRTADSFRRLASSYAERVPAGFALSRQWSCLLDGATAPEELLDNLASRSLEIPGRAGAAQADAVRGSVPQSRKFSSTPGLVEAVEVASPFEASEATHDAKAVVDRQFPRDGSVPPALRCPVRSSAANLISPNGSCSHSAETDSVDWDLTALSRTISQILNEDAHRHGIDV